MGSTIMTIRLDDTVKRDFEAVVNNLGMNMTTAFTLFAKATVRRQGIPFDLAIDDPLTDPIVKAEIEKELARRLELAKDPNTKWYSTEEVRRELGLQP